MRMLTVASVLAMASFAAADEPNWNWESGVDNPTGQGTVVQEGSSVLDKLDQDKTDQQRWRKQQWLEKYGNPRKRGGRGGSGGGGGDSGGSGGHG